MGLDSEYLEDGVRVDLDADFRHRLWIGEKVFMVAGYLETF